MTYRASTPQRSLATPAELAAARKSYPELLRHKDLHAGGLLR